MYVIILKNPIVTSVSEEHKVAFIFPINARPSNDLILVTGN